MREFLLKLARAIARHYAASCIYEAKVAGQCLCKYCEKTECPNHRLISDLEVTNVHSIKN